MCHTSSPEELVYRNTPYTTLSRRGSTCDCLHAEAELDQALRCSPPSLRHTPVTI